MDSKKVNDYPFECVYCDPKLELHLTSTKEAMINHCRVVHNVEEQIAKKYYRESSTSINDMPNVNLVQIFEKLPWEERMKIEQVCKIWQYVSKNLCWSNYRTFDNEKYEKWPEERYRKKVAEIKSLFERCGRNLRHLILRNWSPEVVLSLIAMTPNVQHLKLSFVKLRSEHFRELAQILPNLKSFGLDVFFPHDTDSFEECAMGLMEFLKVMSCLEYLSLRTQGMTSLFLQHSFDQFPPYLKYLALSCSTMSATKRILPWVAKGCKHLKGLRVFQCTGNEKVTQAISQMKSLTYLDMTYGYAHLFEALTELRAFKTEWLNDMGLTAITQHCKKLEHFELEDISKLNLLPLNLLPNFCSLTYSRRGDYSRTKIIELINRFIANGKLEYIEAVASYNHQPLEPELLFELLRCCKSIQSIALNFGPINSDFYAKICQVVDEINERDNRQCAVARVTHPVVELQYNKKIVNAKLGTDKERQYKWLRFTDEISPPAVVENCRFGFLEAGKPAWEWLKM